MDKFTTIAIKQAVKRALRHVEKINPESTRTECLSAAAKTAGTLEAIIETLNQEAGEQK